MACRFISRCALFVQLLACSVTGAGIAGAGELPQTFTSQYRPAVERLRQAYANVSAEGVITIELPRDGKSSEQSFALHAGGQYRRLDLKTIAQQGMGLKVGANLMQMATPIGSLNTETGPKSQFFDDAQETKYNNTIANIERGCLFNYPFALDSQTTILDMLRSHSVKVTGIKWVRENGTPLVRIDYVEHGTHAGKHGKWNSTLLLAPSDGWALRSFSRSLGHGSGAHSQSGQLEYAPGPDGIPLVQSIRIETSEGGRPVRRQSVEASEVRFGKPDPELFDSYAF